MEAKNIFMTGATSGLGKVMAESLARQNVQLFVLARDQKKAETLTKSIVEQGGLKPEFIKGDLLNMQDASAAAAQFLDMDKPLHGLINNAGGVFPRKGFTAEGLEKTMALNYFSLVVLTNALVPKLKETAQDTGQATRVVNTASDAYMYALPGLNLKMLKGEKTTPALIRYGHAKLANIMYTQSLAEQLEGDNVTVNCFHPGVVDTQFGSDNKWLRFGMFCIKPFLRTCAQGAATGAFLAQSQEVSHISGRYFYKEKQRALLPLATNKVTIKKLKDETSAILNFT